MQGCCTNNAREVIMRNVEDKELAQICGGDGGVSTPPVGVTQAQWNDLLFRLEWERKNDPYRREN